MMALITVQAFSMNKTICGPTDDRVPSTNPKIARALDSRTGTGGCTITMISKSCAISAGHCKGVLKVAEFNTPASRNGNIQHPEAKDVYDIDQSSIVYKSNGPGDDWAVFKVKKNDITGEYAGDAQGFYNVSYDVPELGTILRITGYGLDRSEPTKNLAQQTNSGELTGIGIDDDWYGNRPAALTHKVDTMGGNSGSTIIRESDDMIVGIHTHGGCSSWGGGNQGTLISKHEVLMNHIKSCLESDK